MKHSVYILFLIVCLVAAYGTAVAQTQAADTISTTTSIDTVKSIFKKGINEQLRLYNGREYTFYPPTIKGNPFFMDIKTYMKSTIVYDGSVYTNVPVMFDLTHDFIVVLLYRNVSNITLINTKVRSFDIMGHHFIRLVADSTTAGSISTGYYDELYNGKTQVLVRREKNLQTDVSTQQQYFNPRTVYYIKKDNVYHSINSQGAILKIFKDKNKELKQYAKTNGIKFNKDKEQSMVKLASFYDHLSQ